MIKFENAVFLKKGHPLTESFSISFDKGINILDENDNLIFRYLLLDDGIDKKGDFFIDEKNEKDLEGDNFFLIVFRIKSSSVVLTAGFLVNKDNRNEKVESLKDELIALRTLNVNSKQDHSLKISKILDILKAKNAIYVLLDQNEKVNNDHYDEIFVDNAENLNDFVFISLPKPAPVVAKVEDEIETKKIEEAILAEEEKVTAENKKEKDTIPLEKVNEPTPIQETEEVFPDFSTKENDNEIISEVPLVENPSIIENKPVIDSISKLEEKEVNVLNDNKKSDSSKEKKIKSKPILTTNKVETNDEEDFVIFNNEYINKGLTFGYFFKFFAKNWNVFIFLLIPALGMFSFFLLLPYYYANLNYTVANFLLFGSIVCFILFFVFEYNLYDFYKNEENELADKKYKIVCIWNFIILLLGIGGGIGLFYLIASLDKKFIFDNYFIQMIIPGFSIYGVSVFTPLFIKPIWLLRNRIARFIGKKKNKNK